MTEEEALAVCFRNLKGSKDKDLLGTAQALRYLKGLPQYRNNTELGRGVGVSREIVRQFLTLLRFPKAIQRLFATNHLGLDQGDSLWQLARKRRDILPEAAQIATKLTAEDTRYLVDHLTKFPELSVSEAADAIAGSRPIIQREFHIMAPLSEEEYSSLSAEARRRRLDVTELVSAIVKEWLSAAGAS